MPAEKEQALRRWIWRLLSQLPGAAVFFHAGPRIHHSIAQAAAFLPFATANVSAHWARTAGAPFQNHAARLLNRLALPDSAEPLSYADIVTYVGAAADAKDENMRGHLERTAEYAVILGRELGLSAPDLDRLRLAALLHDIGKLTVRTALLRKPGRLSDNEREEIRQHARDGAHMLRGNSTLASVLPAIEFHHECWNGSGYPYGLSGESIPILARLVAVADTYDALTSYRVYQQSVTPEKAATVIRSLSGTRFWPAAVMAFEIGFARGAFDSDSEQGVVPQMQWPTYATQAVPS